MRIGAILVAFLGTELIFFHTTKTDKIHRCTLICTVWIEREKSNEIVRFDGNNRPSCNFLAVSRFLVKYHRPLNQTGLYSIYSTTFSFFAFYIILFAEVGFNNEMQSFRSANFSLFFFVQGSTGNRGNCNLYWARILPSNSPLLDQPHKLR